MKKAGERARWRLRTILGSSPAAPGQRPAAVVVNGKNQVASLGACPATSETVSGGFRPIPGLSPVSAGQDPVSAGGI
jgi:hypothetical protein